MLGEHLSATHDAASRRPETIDAHVAWIHEEVLKRVASRILDLGCGPGLYASRLARLGHECIGIDYSPASIEYARSVAGQDGLRCEYTCEDIRDADYGSTNTLVMLISGELNVFRPDDARLILTRARDSAADRGLLLLEVQTEEAIARRGSPGRLWHARQASVFSDRAHVWLEERVWDPITKTTAVRYSIVGGNGEVDIYGQTFQAYSQSGYRELITSCGFEEVSLLPSLRGTPDAGQADLYAILARSTLVH
jgi:SAM-dependent methyltransferase